VTTQTTNNKGVVSYIQLIIKDLFEMTTYNGQTYLFAAMFQFEIQPFASLDELVLIKHPVFK